MAEDKLRRRSPGQVFKDVLFALILRDVKGRLGKNRLGVITLLAEPVLHLVVLLAIFSYVGGRSLPGIDYPIFLFTGVSAFILFKNISLKLMSAAEAGKALFAYRQIQPIDLFLSRMLVEFGLSICVYIVIATGLAWLGYSFFPPHPLEWIATIIIGVIICTALGILFSIANDLLPGFDVFIRLSFMPLYLLSGVVFPIRRIPAEWIPLLSWNPFLHIIELVRHYAVPGYNPAEWVSIGYPLSILLATSLFASISYGLFRNRLSSH